MLCSLLAIVYVVEQPVSSLLWEHPDVARALLETDPIRVCVKLGAFGALSAKPVHLVGTASWLFDIQLASMKGDNKVAS